jgi:transcriptional regulator with XRE-family HTH domain
MKISNRMKIGNRIKAIRELKNLSQKEVAVALKMDPAQYSRIEKSDSDPSLSTIERIAGALGVSIVELVGNEIKEVDLADKSIIEKIRFIESLDEKEKNAFFVILESVVSNKKFKKDISVALGAASSS